MEKMTDGMINAAKTAGISMERAEEIYRMKVLGREFYQSDGEGLNITSYEASWIVDVLDILSKDCGTWDPKAYHIFERKKVAKKHIESAIWAILGKDAIWAHELKLNALATGLNDLMVDLFDDIKLGFDDLGEIAEKIVQHVDGESERAIDVAYGFEPPD